MASLVLLRHGRSTWNDANLFTGWVDVPLSPAGEAEAVEAGEALAAEADLDLAVVHTSLLRRAIQTADIALAVAEKSYLPVRRHWRLNERHYGALQGLDKKQVAAEHGAEQLKAWRRGYSTPPPPLATNDPSHPVHDPRYREIMPSALPSAECLADVTARILPYLEDVIARDLFAGRDVLVVAHGNSLRALVKILEHISDEDITDLDVPTGVPRLYRLGRSLEVLEARYLGDESAVAAAAEEVRRQAG